MRTAKTLNRLGGCPGWSESSLDAEVILLVLSCVGSFTFSSPFYTISYTNTRSLDKIVTCIIWTASSEFVTYRLCEQRRFRRACASAQSRQNLRCSLIQAVNQEEPSDRKPDPRSLWMAGHAQLKFVMTECSKTQIRLTGLIIKLFLIFNVITFRKWFVLVVKIFHFWIHRRPDCTFVRDSLK